MDFSDDWEDCDGSMSRLFFEHIRNLKWNEMKIDYRVILDVGTSIINEELLNKISRKQMERVYELGHGDIINIVVIKLENLKRIYTILIPRTHGCIDRCIDALIDLYECQTKLLELFNEMTCIIRNTTRDV